MFTEFKKIFKSFILFFCIFLISDQILGLGYRYSIDYVSSFWARKYLKLHHAIKKKYDLIFIGDSRMMFSASPRILSKELGVESFNLSFDAMSLEVQIEVLKVLKKYNNEPKSIVMNISSLWIKQDQENFNVFNILYPLGENSGLISRLFPFESKLSWINSLRYHKIVPEIINGLRKKNIPFDYGYRTSQAQSICKIDSSLCKRDIPNHTPAEARELAENEIKLGTYRYIDELIDFIDKSGLNVQFLVIPFHSTNNLEYAKRNQVISHVVNYIKAKNHNVLDFRTDKFLNKDNFYRDVAHLNNEGSNLFSKELAKEMRNHF